MSSGSGFTFSALEYRHAGCVATPDDSFGGPDELAGEAPAAVPGVSEEEVERRVFAARNQAIAETEQRLRAEFERRQQAAQEQTAETLRAFAEERKEYFARVESEVVHLALAIARKILQREAELDPTLLAALVRIALDRMQSGPSVRLRVVPAEVERWQKLGAESDNASRWEVVADSGLVAGDCVVETELGNANFGFEAQLRDVEETFAQLIACKPERA